MDGQIQRLNDIVRHLRGPDGCKWDRKQKIEDFIGFLREELVEFETAYTSRDLPNLREELGDVFCQFMFIAEICEENRWFSLSESIASICEKLIRRHPHIFNVSEQDDLESDKVIELWNKVKQDEKSRKDHFIETTMHLKDSFRFAEMIQQKASAVKFDWDNPGDVMKKVKEEVEELDEVLHSGNNDRIEAELGDIMFSLINLSRFLKIDLGSALQKSNEKFISRFKKIEEKLKSTGVSILDADFQTLDKIWDSVKAEDDQKDI